MKFGSAESLGTFSVNAKAQSEHCVKPARYSALQKGQNMVGVYNAGTNKEIYSSGVDSRISRIISRARDSFSGRTNRMGFPLRGCQRVRMSFSRSDISMISCNSDGSPPQT